MPRPFPYHPAVSRTLRRRPFASVVSREQLSLHRAGSDTHSERISAEMPAQAGPRQAALSLGPVEDFDFKFRAAWKVFQRNLRSKHRPRGHQSSSLSSITSLS